MLSLLEARMIKGISLGEAAKHIGSSEALMLHLEGNPIDIKVCDAILLADLYGIDLKMITFK